MSNIQPLPNAGQVRASMPSDSRRRNLAKAIALLIPSVALYLAAWLLVISAPWWLWPILSPIAGVAAGLLFVIAHDAGHDAFTPFHALNSFLARILFLPSWHCYSGWVHAHNHVHHGWTNFQPRDYVWAPMALADFRRLPRGKRWLARVYRWWPGFWLYYLVEVLIKKILIVQPEVRRGKTRLRWVLDDLFVAAGFAVQAAATVWIARASGAAAHPALIVVAAQIIPGLVTIWFVAFVTYLQHTHPSIPWFQDLDEWTFYTGQVLGTSHTDFARGINRLIHNVMEHTAHHVDPRIPLYHLRRAQERLEDDHPPVRHNFSWRSFGYLQRTCQTYDFERHCWFGFDGRQTSSRTVDEEILERARASRTGSAKHCSSLEAVATAEGSA